MERRKPRKPSVIEWPWQPLPERMQALVEEKAGGNEFAAAILLTIAYSMVQEPKRWEIFMKCTTYIGDHFLRKVLNAVRHQPGDPASLWRWYASSVIRQAIKQGDVTTPPNCLLSRNHIKERWKQVRGGRRWNPLRLETVFAGHLGDKAALRKLTGVFCVGCKVRGCAHQLNPTFRSVPPPPPPVVEPNAHESGTFKKGDPGTPVHLPVIPDTAPFVRIRIAL